MRCKMYKKSSAVPKTLNTIGNFKVRAERGDNERSGSHREMRKHTKKTPGSKTRGITLGSPPINLGEHAIYPTPWGFAIAA